MPGFTEQQKRLDSFRFFWLFFKLLHTPLFTVYMPRGDWLLPQAPIPLHCNLPRVRVSIYMIRLRMECKCCFSPELVPLYSKCSNHTKNSCQYSNQSIVSIPFFSPLKRALKMFMSCHLAVWYWWLSISPYCLLTKPPSHLSKMSGYCLVTQQLQLSSFSTSINPDCYYKLLFYLSMSRHS